MIDVSLNKSHMTMEDNNKVARKVVVEPQLVNTQHNHSKSANVVNDSQPLTSQQSKIEAAFIDDMEERKTVDSVITQTEIKQSE